MARTVKKHEYAVKRNEIIEVAQRLVYTKGYEQMAIRDILDALQISKGAFYHYFDSKQALLEALIERMQLEGEAILVTIMEDPHLPTIAKLQRFFDTAGRWKTERKAYILAMTKLWYDDHNAVIRYKVQATLVQHVVPILTQAIHAGVREGVLSTPFPNEAGAIALALLQGLGDAFVPLLFSTEPKDRLFERAMNLVAAYNDALERVLGATTGALHLIDTATLHEWFVE